MGLGREGPSRQPLVRAGHGGSRLVVGGDAPIFEQGASPKDDAGPCDLSLPPHDPQFHMPLLLFPHS